jgi:hypothetical protein
MRIEKGAISIPKMGKLPIILHRKLASRIKMATIQFKHGKWSISLTHSSSRMQERKTSAIKACRVRYQQSAHPCWL